MSFASLQLEDIQHRYQHSSVRDIAWLMLSPSLFHAPLGPYQSFNPYLDLSKTLEWFDELDSSTCSSTCSSTSSSTCSKNAALPQRSQFRRLGLYCEALFEAFFRLSDGKKLSPYRYIARNIQLMENKTTLGELDFLLQDNRTDKVVHVELAVKFFLQSQPQSQNWCDWIGPNARDRLDLKLTRMAEHQLALPHQAASNATLAQACQKINCAAPVRSLHFIKGALFSHQQSHSQTLPKNAAITQSQGSWLHLGQLEGMHASRFYLCEKMEWLVPNDAASLAHSSGETIEEVANGGSGPEMAKKIQALHARSRKNFKGGVPGAMLLQVDERGCASRLMIVPNYWPATSSPSRNM